jgi:SnoaL-like polyketide cyclase
MDTEANKALVRRYVELYNTGNMDIADEVIAADFVDHTHPELRPGPEDVKKEVKTFRHLL